MSARQTQKGRGGGGEKESLPSCQERASIPSCQLSLNVLEYLLKSTLIKKKKDSHFSTPHETEMVWPSVKSPKILFQLTTTKTWKDSHTQSCQIPDNCLKNLIPINSHFETIASHTAVADKTPSSDCTQSTNNTVFMYKIAPIHTAGWCKPLSVFLSKKKKKTHADLSDKIPS